MTARPVFGDFARAAHAQLADVTGPPSPGSKRKRGAAQAGQIQEFTRGLAGVVAVMERYSADISAMFTGLTARQRRELSRPWAQASVQVHEAIQNAAGFLSPVYKDTGRFSRRWSSRRDAGGLDAAAVFLTAGRDLLHTHFAAGPEGARLDRSEWAPVVTSGPVTRALLLELGHWARTIAPQGARLALSGTPVKRGTDQQRRRLNAACQWLWVLDAAVQAAQRRDPVPAADIGLLHAIPVNALARRHLPAGTETIAELCQGTASTAERVRHAARFAVADASWSPALTADSLVHAAAAATVISHNSEILLRSLAASARDQGVPGLVARLLGSADAAAAARERWLQAAREWRRITTDTRGTIAPAATETADLALWTGRLAYTDPRWTPATGPSQAVRSPQSLAPGPGDLPQVVAAVHQACETLTGIAAADYGQIRTAAQAGRLLVPTRSLPDTFDVPHPFAPAPRDRADIVLAAYRDAGRASAQATAAVAAVAADVRAPSQFLTAARDAVRARAGRDAVGELQLREAAVTAGPGPVPPGPVERILSDLGVTNPDVLRRAAAIDEAGEQMILDVARSRGTRRSDARPADLSRSAGTAEVIDHLLASGDPRATAILRPPPPRFPRPHMDRLAAEQGHLHQQGSRQAPDAEAEP